MAARRAQADFIDVFNGFHGGLLSCCKGKVLHGFAIGNEEKSTFFS